MIVREREDTFVMIEQHHHGKIAGQLYTQLKDHLLPDFRWRNEVLTAVVQHDCGWIPFDKEPLWNDEKNVPYSFIDLPIGLKIILYKNGIDQIATMSPYAALLCSIHYVSFLKKRQDELSQLFVSSEQIRQAQIQNSIQDPSYVQKHYDLLKFFDDLSLYICLHEPNTKKAQTHFFFKDGLTVPTHFHLENIQINWDKEKISLNHHLFKEDVVLSVEQRVVSKKLVQKMGINKAYQASCIEKVPITIEKP